MNRTILLRVVVNRTILLRVVVRRSNPSVGRREQNNYRSSVVLQQAGEELQVSSVVV